MGRIDLSIELERQSSWNDWEERRRPSRRSPRKIQDKQSNDAPKKEETKKSPSKIVEDRGTENGSPSNDNNHAADIYKDYFLYLAAKNGSLNDFSIALNRISSAEQVPYHEILCRASPAGNTFLHLAAKQGHEEIVNYIALKDPSLVLYKNSKGETALHLAAKAGDESMVKILVGLGSQIKKEGDDENDLLRTRNERGNTALHEALINGWTCVALYLIEEDPEVSYYQNKNGNSALYLAARAGSADCVSLILGSSTDQERINEQFEKNSPIQAAIKARNRDVLEVIFKKNPSFIQSRDGEGKTPFHYASSLGYVEELRYLLSINASSVTQRDKSGSLPIHLASIKGHVDIIILLLQYCPDAGELLDRGGRNILHLAAFNGRYNIVRYILDNPDLNDLINMKDDMGNVPLHSATINWHPKIVSALTWDERVDVKMANNRRMTALDVADFYMSYNPQFSQRLTWAALKAAGTPRSLSGKTQTSKRSSNMENYRERVNTLLLVSTLVATITFAAGFTVPGGYISSSDRDSGMATMLKDKAFNVFVLCDIIAMHSSIVVAVSLIWAQLGDLTLALNALTLAVPLLGIALGMMSMAFTAGVFLVISKLRWLAIAVLIMGIAFLAILILFILLFCSPYTSSNRILRCLCYYPFHLLILASTILPKA